MIVISDQKILRLQIPVYDAFRVRRRQSFRNLLGKFQNALERHLRIFPDDVLQVLSLDVGHGDEPHSAHFAHIVNTQNIFMRNFTGEH